MKHESTLIKKSNWVMIVFYILIVFEFFYMVSPFAVIFYSLYAPGLKLLSSNNYTV